MWTTSCKDVGFGYQVQVFILLIPGIFGTLSSLGFLAYNEEEPFSLLFLILLKRPAWPWGEVS